MKEYVCPRCSTVNVPAEELNVFYCQRCGAKLKRNGKSCSLVEEGGTAAQESRRSYTSYTEPERKETFAEKLRRNPRKKRMLIYAAIAFAGLGVFLVGLLAGPSWLITPGWLTFFVFAAIIFGM